jgi:hypothetical protein
VTKTIKRIHFIAQDEGSVKALLPVFTRSASWPRVSAHFYAAKYGLKYLELQHVECRKFPGAGLYPDDSNVPNLIVAGASMWDSIEKQAIDWARAKGIPSLTIVDHGSNLWGRFTKTGKCDLSSLPDMILAPDEESKANMVNIGFPPKHIIVTGNPNFDGIKPAPRGHVGAERRVILCIMQPEYSDGEYRSDVSWFPIITGLAEEFGKKVMMIVRPHPKEGPDGYRPLERMGIDVDDRSAISDLIIKSDIVIGKNSTSLIEAVFRGKVVISMDLGKNRFERLPTDRMGLSDLASSENELKKLIGKACSESQLTKKLKRIRYYNDGKNTGRAWKCVWDMLNRSTQKEKAAVVLGSETNG